MMKQKILPDPYGALAAREAKTDNLTWAFLSNLSIPLCVDLDGTLTRTDLLLESFLVLIKKNPLYVFMCIVWLFHGKAYLKDQIAERTAIDVSILPYNATLIDYLRTERSKGRMLYLCTATNQRFAEQIAAHFGFFSGVLASCASHNLSGSKKAQTLADKFGERGFDYCGNELVDVPVWQRARQAIVVGKKHIAKAAMRVNKTIIFFEEKRPLVRLALKEMRVYQWVKNFLIFVPLLASHRFLDTSQIVMAAVAFLSFSLCASSVYLLNDMLDLDADRRHARKCKRPLASGQLPLSAGIFLIGALLVGAAGLAAMLPKTFMLVLAGYFALTVIYSFKLKRVILIDVFALASLYTIRIVAGAAAGSIHLSFWLILFSVLIFLSLAMVKRYAELDAVLREGNSAAAGRGYIAQDIEILRSLGTAAGYLAVLVLALYLNSPEVNTLYRHPKALWVMFVLLLYWISRMWMFAFRGQMNDDPIVFAIKDRMSFAVIAMCVASVILAV